MKIDFLLLNNLNNKRKERIMASKVVRLQDLYQVGKEVNITGPEGSVAVYVKKLNPLDHETALRRAQSARAKVLVLARSDENDGENELREAMMSDFLDLAKTREDQVEFLVADKILKVYQAREAEIGAEEKWQKDNYLQSLKDSWNEEMSDRFINDVNDEEAKKIKDELQVFQDEVNKTIETERDILKRDYDSFTDSKLIDLGSKLLLESGADMAWLSEYRKCEIWLGILDPKTKKKYFNSKQDVDELPVEVLSQLMEAYASLNVEVVETKKSVEVPDS